jgi:hypothetical protein
VKELKGEVVIDQHGYIGSDIGTNITKNRASVVV